MITTRDPRTTHDLLLTCSCWLKNLDCCFCWPPLIAQGSWPAGRPAHRVATRCGRHSPPFTRDRSITISGDHCARQNDPAAVLVWQQTETCPTPRGLFPLPSPLIYKQWLELEEWPGSLAWDLLQTETGAGGVGGGGISFFHPPL